MREIKFRAWDKCFQEILEVSQLWIDPKSHMWGAGILDKRNDFHKMEDIVLMQYAGLKDRIGKEIYEGDIIEQEAYNGEPYNLVGVVEYQGTGFCLRCIKSNREYFSGIYYSFAHILISPYSKDDMKLRKGLIVGNIFENPELLNLSEYEIFR